MKPAYSMRRGYRILFLHCKRCRAEQPFFRINSWPSPQKKIVKKVGEKWVAQESPNPIPYVSEDARKINAACMVCGTTGQFVVSVKVLGKSQYAMSDLCSCGLPTSHVGNHLEVRRGRTKA